MNDAEIFIALIVRLERRTGIYLSHFLQWGDYYARYSAEKGANVR